MPQAILKFNLPEEIADYLPAVNGWKWKQVLCNLDEFLRRKVKYEDLPKETQEIYDNLRDVIRTEMSDYDLYNLYGDG